MADGSVAWNREISRQKQLHTFRQFPPQTLIAMEACSTSHFWGRTLISMGYDVKLIPTQHVKAFTRHQKNDANDALAICETACRPRIHFVSVKTTEQQDIKALRSARQFIVEQRTALANQLGHYWLSMEPFFQPGYNVFNNNCQKCLKTETIR